MTRLPVSLALSLSLIGPPAPSSDTEQTLLVRCGRLIDGRSAQAAAGLSVQIAGDRITAIGRNLAAPPNASCPTTARGRGWASL